QDIQIAGPMIKIGAIATAEPYKARNNHTAKMPARGSHEAGGDGDRRPWIPSEMTAITTIAAPTFHRRTLFAVRKRFMIPAVLLWLIRSRIARLGPDPSSPNVHPRTNTRTFCRSAFPG